MIHLTRRSPRPLLRCLDSVPVSHHGGVKGRPVHPGVRQWSPGSKTHHPRGRASFSNPNGSYTPVARPMVARCFFSAKPWGRGFGGRSPRAWPPASSEAIQVVKSSDSSSKPRWSPLAPLRCFEPKGPKAAPLSSRVSPFKTADSRGQWVRDHVYKDVW